MDSLCCPKANATTILFILSLTGLVFLCYDTYVNKAILHIIKYVHYEECKKH